MDLTNNYVYSSHCRLEGLGEIHGIALLDMVSFIKSKLRIESLYLLGVHCKTTYSQSVLFPNDIRQKEQYQLDMLVISKNIPTNTVADLSNCIKTLTKGVYNVILLIHKPSEVKNSKSPLQSFFSEVWQHGLFLTGCCNLQSLQPKEALQERNQKDIHRFCAERCQAAKHLLALEYQLESDNVSLMEVSFLHQAVEQLCIALIYKYICYYPNHFHLGYLLDLCKGFTNIGEEVFPRQSIQDQELFQILSRPLHDMRFKKLDSYKRFQVEVLEYRCREFYDKATALLLDGKA